MHIEPSNQTFSELMSNSTRYVVPRFQRNYSWQQEQWEDLWNDIQELGTEDAHYMGYMVLQRRDRNQFEIIDGQQRMVTLTLLILAYMGKLQTFIEAATDVANNRERLEEIRSRYIGVKNLITLSVDSRLTLNRNNKTYFKGICDQLVPSNPRQLIQSNRLLKKAFEYFTSKITATTGLAIAQQIEQFTASLIFTKIVVQDSINAYKVFETLNARGVQLSTPDLIKNYIFSTIAATGSVNDTELDELDEKWSGILAQLGEKNFTDFVRYLFNSTHSFVTKKELFKQVKAQYHSPELAAAYLNTMETGATIYTALLHPHETWWNSVDDTYLATRPYLEAFKLFGLKQPNIILLAAYRRFSPSEFVKMTQYLYVLSIRYNIICNHSANEQERRYNDIAQQIADGTFSRASHVKNSSAFKELYPTDEVFQNIFTRYKMPSRRFAKKIRFLLAEIENHFGRGVDYRKVTLEHICPYRPTQDWITSFGEGVHEVQDRLGNMVLLDRDELGRISYEEKQRLYVDSPFRLATKVAESPEWTLASVNNFQSWLAERAIRTWRVDYQ